MNVNNHDLVIVRGVNSDWVNENFKELIISFGGQTPQTTPKEDAYYVGLYQGAPISAITHIGIVSDIHRFEGGADFYLTAIIKLKKTISTGHGIRKHENWTLSQLQLDQEIMRNLRDLLLSL